VTLKPKRRWYQFSLQRLLVGMTVLCVGLGGYLVLLRQRTARHKAELEMVAKNGGTILWDDTPLDRTPVMRWLLGDDTPEGIYYDRPSVVFTDADLMRLKTFPKLRILDLSDSQVTDANLRQVARLRKLESLRLKNTKVTDTGLSYLVDMVNLKELHVSGSLVTDKGGQRLKEALPELEIVQEVLP